jgi:hypothetical protein
VTWVVVPKPSLDLVGLVLGALSLAAVCAAVATVLGAALGVSLIVRNRRRPLPSCTDDGLHLLESRAPGPLLPQA